MVLGLALPVVAPVVAGLRRQTSHVRTVPEAARTVPGLRASRVASEVAEAETGVAHVLLPEAELAAPVVTLAGASRAQLPVPSRHGRTPAYTAVPGRPPASVVAVPVGAPTRVVHEGRQSPAVHFASVWDAGRRER